MPRLRNIFRLGIKELYSLARDPVMVFLIVWLFTAGTYTVTKGIKFEVENASIALVDEDRSQLSSRIRDAFLPPYFKPPALISLAEMDRAMDTGKFIFVVDIPRDFEADVVAGRQPTIQVNVDATAMSQAGNGAGYISNIINRELRTYLGGESAREPATLAVRVRFNPNLEGTWFTAIMQVINNVTVLAIILCGAAVIREREHGTIEHLLVMPLTPAQIVLAKIWANSLVVLAAATFSLIVVVRGLLGVPVIGSVTLFITGTAVYLFSVTGLGVMLATIARSMPQFGLLSIPVFVVLNLLSGSTTPIDSMPGALQIAVQGLPSTHFVSFSQAVLYRGAGLDLVWRELAAIALIGAIYFGFALLRFRATVSAVR